MTGTSTSRVVLDTSVVAKSILAPPRHLPQDIYEREVETRRKIRVILDLLEEYGYEVFFPRAGVVEIVSVLKRYGVAREVVLEVVEAINNTFTIVGEDTIYSEAVKVALATAPSGFDTYFLALALITDSLLITDDKRMADHARRLGLDVILVREAGIDYIRERIARRKE